MYKQCEIRTADNRYRLAWLPEKIVKPNRQLRIDNELWTIIKIYGTDKRRNLAVSSWGMTAFELV
jgi:hypothetical protein